MWFGGTQVPAVSLLCLPGEGGGVPVNGRAAAREAIDRGGEAPQIGAMKKQRRSRAYLIYIAQVTP